MRNHNSIVASARPHRTRIGIDDQPESAHAPCLTLESPSRALQSSAPPASPSPASPPRTSTKASNGPPNNSSKTTQSPRPSNSGRTTPTAGPLPKAQQFRLVVLDRDGDLIETDQERDRSSLRRTGKMRIRRVLALLDQATEPRHLAIPGFGLHPLLGRFRDHWSVSVSGNWRIVFRFDGGEAVDVQLIDYH